MTKLFVNLSRKIYLKVSRIITLPFKTFEAGTYLYPFYGVHYFFTHPELWAFYLTIFIPQLILILLTYILMYVIFYPIQALVAVLLSGPIGLVNAWIAVLQQSGLVSIFIVTNLMMPEIQRIAFDAVLSREFADDVVLLGKLRRIVKVPFLVKCGRIFWSIPNILVFPYVIFKALLMLAISTIPFLGPALVIVLQAPSKGLQSHARYYALKGFDKRQIKAIYRAHTAEYMGFGIISNLLEQIPFFSVFFMFTNTVGAALWVVTIEQKQKKNDALKTFESNNLKNNQKYKHETKENDIDDIDNEKLSKFDDDLYNT